MGVSTSTEKSSRLHPPMNILSKTQTKTARAKLESEFSRALSSSLSAMLESREIQIESSSADIAQEMIWLEEQFEPVSFGAITFGIRPSDAVALGHQLLSSSGLEGESDDTAVATLEEVFSKTAHSLATVFALESGMSINAKPLVRRSTEPENTSSFAASIANTGLSASNPVVFVYASWNVLSALAPIQDAKPFVPSAPTPAPASPAAPMNTRNLELLLEVEMPVSISFGRTQLALRDVLRLNTGSVVEMNRTVSEPVEIIVNNAVIARGEVVVVDGNFGVRVNQVISRQDRLNTLV